MVANNPRVAVEEPVPATLRADGEWVGWSPSGWYIIKGPVAYCPLPAINKKTRSNNQNKYLWGVVYRTIQEFSKKQELTTAKGEEISCQDIHDMCAMKFLPESDVCEVWGMSVAKRQSTTKLDTQEFNEYVMRIQEFFAGIGLYIPDPNEGEFKDWKRWNTATQLQS